MLRKHTDSIVIRPRVSTRARVVLVAGGVVLLLGLCVAAYWAGRWQSATALATAQSRVGALEQRIQSLDSTNKELAASLAQAERQLQIDKSAYGELSGMLEASNKQIMDLRNEIKFYRSIISPEDGKAGVRIQEFSTFSTDVAGEFRYKLVLTQALQHGKDFQGKVTFEVKGTAGDVARTLPLPTRESRSVPIKFKYFQTLSGVLVMPGGMVPREVKVSVSADPRRPPVAEHWYAWSPG